ncbi:MAG: type II CRISPR RNA-guided endonuclease Cas9 [Flavobacteriaceae bacterium]
MKKILGLDIGTTSIGWALVNESENEKSSIEKVGVRIIPLSADEENDFQKGKSITLNANRTSKRGMRRNLHRYKLRRKALLKVLLECKIISPSTLLTNDKGEGKNPYKIWSLRAKAVHERIELEEFARVLFAINKKRGYKSNRKAKDEGDGQAIDGMDLAKKLYHENMTPGELMLQRLEEGKKGNPDFYRSDLQNEFDRIWEKQCEFYKEQLTDDLKRTIQTELGEPVWKICQEPWGTTGIKRKGKKYKQTLENYNWRVTGLHHQLDLEHLVIVLQEIRSKMKSTSGLLSEISDRSKELYFNQLTVGQYLFNQIKANKHTRLKKQVFYRQDYLDEFEIIWETQSKFHSVLTAELKAEIRDVIIFYQRRLKSQKGLISICELEGKEVTIEIDGKPKRKVIGPKVCPKSSPLFQEFKIWQKINDLEFKNVTTKEKKVPELELKEQLFQVLNISNRLSPSQIINFSELKSNQGWEINFKNGLDGNQTNTALYEKFKQIVEISGHNIDWNKLNAEETTKTIEQIFSTSGIDPDILHFNTDLEGHDFTRQPAYQLWHLLYSYEGDNSKTGDEKLIEKLHQHFGFEKEYAKILSKVVFKDDYGSLSTKAMLKLIPHLKAGSQYSKKKDGDAPGACEYVGYNHSKSLTKEERAKRPSEDKLELLSKNSLRNPVVEKILNQLVNVVNSLIDQYGKPDEIRVELARELKKSAKERAEMTQSINKTNSMHDAIRENLKTLYPFNTGVRITRKDIIKYKLWEELGDNGHKTLYTNIYVPLEKLFSKEFDVEHIIPKARLFDDSFSNKTISTRDFNAKKGNKTGVDAVAEYYGEEGKEKYLERVEHLYRDNKISKAKYQKLKMTEEEIPDGFIDRDLRNSQYIAKKAIDLLSRICNDVTSTTGGVTDKLRQDWQLVNVMQELNWEKYEKSGLVGYEKNKYGNDIGKIKDWSKRNDHRHHIMDAITVAFTHHSHVQYFNFLNARRDENHKEHFKIKGIEDKETTQDKNGRRIVKPPIPLDEFRAVVKKHLESTLVSFKAKNKVTTRNKNKTKKAGTPNTKIELTPRGQLHKETVYGKKKRYLTKEERVGGTFDVEKIEKVAKPIYKEALIKRLKEFENNSKKAFTGKNTPSKNPIWIDDTHTSKVPDRVKIVELESYYTIRKEVSPDLKIEKVVDKAVQVTLQKRLDEFDGDKKKAFSNLEEKPIWLNKEKGISIKRVTITGVSNVVPLHCKKDHFGNEILDGQGNSVPVDYVSTGNNHHVAIYRDAKGNLQEQVVSFFEAVARKKMGEHIIDKSFNAHLGWKFLFTMKQNEMFVFPNPETGFNPNEINLNDEKNYSSISQYLFRVQKISTKNYFFRHHLETTVETEKKLSGVTYMSQLGLKGINGIVKVRINHLGKIVKVGEY